MHRRRNILWFALGLALAVLHLLLVFLPVFPVLTALIFVAVGYMAHTPGRPSAAQPIVLAALPTWLLSGFFTLLAGAQLFKGIGTFHAANLVIIPAAATIGSTLRRRGVRNEPAA